MLESPLEVFFMFLKPKDIRTWFIFVSSFLFSDFIRLASLWQDFRRCNTTCTCIEGTEHIVMSSSWGEVISAERYRRFGIQRSKEKESSKFLAQFLSYYLQLDLHECNVTSSTYPIIVLCSILIICHILHRLVCAILRPCLFTL